MYYAADYVDSVNCLKVTEITRNKLIEIKKTFYKDQFVKNLPSKQIHAQSQQ